MPLDDLTRLRHMIDAARDARRFLGNRSAQEMADDRVLLLALVKSIEVIGEAATRLSDPLRGRYPRVPWAQVIGMRNRLIHGYYDVNATIVWKTVTEELPALEQTLGDIISREFPSAT